MQDKATEMLTITNLISQRRGEFINLHIDNQFFCSLAPSQVTAWDLYRGRVISKRELNLLRTEADAEKAYTMTLRYLALRIRSVKEVLDYLSKKGFSASSSTVVERLIDNGYLQDNDFAQRWSAMRYRMLWSPRAIRAELVRKGISREIIESCHINDEAGEVIESLIKKKIRHRSYSRDQIIRYLIGRGFRYPDIKLHIDKLITN